MQISQTDTDRIRQLLETFRPDAIEVSFIALVSAQAFLRHYGLTPPYKGISQLMVGNQPYQIEYNWQSRFVYEEGPPITLRENKKIKTLTINLTRIDNDRESNPT